MTHHFAWICAAVAASVAAGAIVYKFRKPKREKVKLDALIMSGPSGVGKGTLINMLLEKYPTKFGFSCSHTSRPPREGEVNGRDYHFVSQEKFKEMIANGEFLESCEVHGNMYGTSKKALENVRATGKIAIIECDVQGAQKFKAQQGDLNFYYMFITATSMEELERRIRQRGKESEEKIAIRLATAKSELAFVESNPRFFQRVLKNDNLDLAFKSLCNIMKLYGGITL